MLEQLVAINIHLITLEIILVNDGSTDESILKITEYIKKYTGEYSFDIIDYGENKGKGFALKQGIKSSKGDYIIVQDADLEYQPKDIIRLLSLMQEKNLGCVYGSRTLGIKEFGNRYSNTSFLFGGILLSKITTLLSGVKVTDEPTCYKLYDAKYKELLTYPEENGFEWEPAVTMLLLRKKVSYGELPIHYYPRDFEHGKKIGWKDGVIAIYTLFKWKIKNIKNV